MERYRIIVGEIAYPVDYVRIEPRESGRVAVWVKAPVQIGRGESCTMRDSAGSEMECVVAENYPELDGTVTELRCLTQPAP